MIKFVVPGIKPWDYIYYERVNGVFLAPKRVTVIFKNEKVAEIYDQHKIIKKMGKDVNNSYKMHL